MQAVSWGRMSLQQGEGYTIGIRTQDIETARQPWTPLQQDTVDMDQDLQSIASARRCAEKAFKAYQDFLVQILHMLMQ